VQHIAYGEQRALVQLRGGTEAHATLRLSQRAVALEGITVRAERSHVHADFHRRMRQALGGTFIGREELERYQNRTVADAVVRLGGAFLGGGGSGLGGFVVLRRHEGPSCQPAVFIDGVQIRAKPMELLFEMHPGSVEGIEVYQGAATVPGEFGGSSAQCGVIAVWTRRG
jgi:outer membrane cobalamin receptor